MTDAEKIRAIHAIGYLRGLSVWVWSQAQKEDGPGVEEAGYFDDQVYALAKVFTAWKVEPDADR